MFAAHYAYRVCVVSLGIDLASDPKRTALCWVRWAGGSAEVTRLERHGADAALLDAICEADKVGIDVPLGWPLAFVRAIAGHTDDGGWPADAPRPTVSPKQLQFRQTDAVVHALTKRWPLSVSSDRIAIPAMRAAALFARLAERVGPVSRDGAGLVTEVYPAAALRRWGFPAVGYKRKENRAARCALLQSIVSQTSAWLVIPESFHTSCEDSDDALDALVAALVARARAVDLCEPIPSESLEAATKEGWIALPLDGSLSLLSGQQKVASF